MADPFGDCFFLLYLSILEKWFSFGCSCSDLSIEILVSTILSTPIVWNYLKDNFLGPIVKLECWVRRVEDGDWSLYLVIWKFARDIEGEKWGDGE